MNIWKERNWKPMLLKEVKEPFDSKDYIFEVKFDGIRALLFATKSKVTLITRNHIDITYLFPELQSIKNIVTKNTIFDGEIIAIKKGLPNFSKVQERFHLKDREKINISMKTNPVIFVAFDILYEGRDLTNLTLLERKDILNKYKDTIEFLKPKYIYDNGIKLFKETKKKNLEGIVAKKKDSTYHINERTYDFIKIKHMQREPFFIGGYIRTNYKISLLLGEYIDNVLYYVGKCSVSLKNPICEKITKLKPSENYFCDCKEDATYIKPTIECYIEYTEKTKNNHLRHPSFKGLV